ncbi:MAG: hypothetical protein ABEJ28_04145 [Salinigranum sp.]
MESEDGDVRFDLTIQVDLEDGEVRPSEPDARRPAPTGANDGDRETPSSGATDRGTNREGTEDGVPGGAARDEVESGEATTDGQAQTTTDEQAKTTSDGGVQTTSDGQIRAPTDAEADAGETTAEDETDLEVTQADEDTEPAESDDSPAESGGDLPPHMDPDRLAEVYETYDTFAEMTEALDTDVTAQTVRHHMIKHGIHEPRTNGVDRRIEDSGRPRTPPDADREEGQDRTDGRGTDGRGGDEGAGGRTAGRERAETDGRRPSGDPEVAGVAAGVDVEGEGDTVDVEGEGDGEEDTADVGETEDPADVGETEDPADVGETGDVTDDEAVEAPGDATADGGSIGTATSEGAPSDDGRANERTGGSADESADEVVTDGVASPADDPDTVHDPGRSDAVAGGVDLGDASGVDADESLELEGLDLPDHLTIGRVREAVCTSDTLYQAQRELGIDGETATRLLRELGLLDLVTGRLSTKSERDVPADEIEDRIRAAAFGAAVGQRESGDA